MRWMIAVLGLVLTGSVQAGFAPRYVTDLPCASETRPVEAYELDLHSTKDFLAAHEKMGCNANTMIEALYVYGGHEPPATSSMFDARINAPANTMNATEADYAQDRANIQSAVAYARDLLRSKQYEEAIAVLEPLYMQSQSVPNSPHFEKPNEYYTYQAARLLTDAYALSNNIPKALEWATTAHSISPDNLSWLHMQILNTQNAQGSKWFSTHSVLNLPFRAHGFNVPRIDLNMNAKTSLRQSIDTLAVFLYNRVEMYPDNDPVTASLLFDLGYLVALTGSYEDAQYVFELSRTYGDKNAAAATHSFEFRELGQHWVDWLLFVVAGIGLIVGAMGFAWVYRWCLRARARKTHKTAWIGTLILGVVSGVAVFGVLLALAAWLLSLSSTTGQAPSSWELLVFLAIVGLTVGGMIVGWTNILHHEIVAVGVKRYWINMALGVLWVVGWMVASVLYAISPHPQVLALNEVLPIILMMPVVAGFVMWVKGLRAGLTPQGVA